MGLVWALSQTISDYYNQMITLSKLPFLLNEASNRYVGNEDLLNLPKPMDNIICDPIKWGLVYYECFTKPFQFVFTGPRQWKPEHRSHPRPLELRQQPSDRGVRLHWQRPSETSEWQSVFAVGRISGNGPQQSSLFEVSPTLRSVVDWENFWW